MLIQLVRYKSGLTHEQVAERFAARAPNYREVPGLLQKYYVHFPATDEHGGVYVWDSPESLERWRESGLAGSLAETYQVEEPPEVELADVMLVLHPPAAATAGPHDQG
jgi:heme-degrading monooxygenase HmoA